MTIQNNQKIRDGACVSQLHSFEITVQPNLFSFLEIFKAQKFGMGLLAPFDHPCHLNLECFPWECTHAQSCYAAKYTCSYYWEGPCPEIVMHLYVSNLFRFIIKQSCTKRAYVFFISKSNVEN